ncbi:hypothetical protein [Xanthomonas sacchari]|uniref:hypothetical protein n=1 Tax=Xanthomonas sacchari TaxID=56458 RepID=UPI0020C3D410|nr:hypothetical protein [Xanthomonas sacchari]
MRNDDAPPRYKATRALARLQRSNAQCPRDAGNREKPADLPAFFRVWENRHSYLDIRNGAAARTSTCVHMAWRSDALASCLVGDRLAQSRSSTATIAGALIGIRD